MKYMCTCGLPIKKLYEISSATWKRNVLDENDQGEIVDYGDSYYIWQCSSKKCYEGNDWQDKPKEASQ